MPGIVKLGQKPELLYPESDLIHLKRLTRQSPPEAPFMSRPLLWKIAKWRNVGATRFPTLVHEV